MLLRTEFGANPNIIGQQVNLNERPYDVIGVTPPGFRGPVWPTFRSAFWIPATQVVDFFRDDALTAPYSLFQVGGRSHPW